MFEQSIASFSFTHLLYRYGAEVLYFLQVGPTKVHIYFACVITLPPLPFFKVGIKQEGGLACAVCSALCNHSLIHRLGVCRVTSYDSQIGKSRPG